MLILPNNTINNILFSGNNGCEIKLDNGRLQRTNHKGKYPLLVNASGDIIYPTDGPKLRFSKKS